MGSALANTLVQGDGTPHRRPGGPTRREHTPRSCSISAICRIGPSGDRADGAPPARCRSCASLSPHFWRPADRPPLPHHRHPGRPPRHHRRRPPPRRSPPGTRRDQRPDRGALTWPNSGLPRHLIPPRYLNDRHALFQDLRHSPIPLLHDTQLHQHTRLPPPRSARDRSEAPRMRKSRKPARSVAPYRNYCRPGIGTKVSGIYRDRTLQDLLQNFSREPRKTG